MGHSGGRSGPVRGPKSLLVPVALMLGLTVSALAQTSDERDATGTATSTIDTQGRLSEGETRPADREGGLADTPSGRIVDVNPDLALEAARVESVNLNDTDLEYVVFRFGRLIHEVQQPSRFALVGFDVESRVAATGARLVQGDPASVLVAFPAGTDVANYSLVSVALGAVVDEAGERNPPTSVTLDGSTVGAGNGVTDGPDLVTSLPVGSLERVVFIFDEELDEGSGADAAAFGYYTPDGKGAAGARVVTLEGTSVTVAFDGQVEDGVRFFATAGAVRNRKGKASTPGAVGQATAAPDLVGFAGPIGRTQWDLVFDTPVSGVDVARVALYSADGTRYTPTGFVQPAPEVVRVAVPPIHDFGDKMVLGSVGHGMVRSNDGSETPGTTGSVRLGGRTPRPGATSGPGLTAVEVDRAVGQLRFIFDANLDDDRAYDPARYLAVTAAGDLLPGRFFVEVAANTVLVTFDRNVVGTLAGAAVLGGAARDFQGEPNPPRTIRS